MLGYAIATASAIVGCRTGRAPSTPSQAVMSSQLIDCVAIVLLALALAVLFDVTRGAARRRRTSPSPVQTGATMPIDTHVRVAAILHIVMASFALLVLAAIGAMVGAFGAFGASMGVAREVAEFVGGVGMILILGFTVIVVSEIVGAVLLLRGSESGRIITIVFSGLALLNIPIGTAIGAYSLWALLRKLPQPMPSTAQPPVRTEPAQSF